MIFNKIAVPALGTMLALGAVNVVEGFLPVTALMVADPIELTDTTYTASIHGYKIKGCIPVEGSFIGWTHDGNAWHEAGIDFIDDQTPDSAKPKSYRKTDFGLWRWPISGETDKVKVTVTHICNGKLGITTVGPFKVEES